jgi:hypothetical protein
MAGVHFFRLVIFSKNKTRIRRYDSHGVIGERMGG